MIPKNFVPVDIPYSKEPACSICTHYISEHYLGPCSRTIGNIVDPDIQDIPSMIHPSIKCNCKGFK